MVAMASLPYPIATSISNRSQIQNTPKNSTNQSSLPISSSPSKLKKRKNYLRQKILKTLTKPYQKPLFPPISEEPISPIESNDPNLETPLQPTSEKKGSSFALESEGLVDANESSSGQFQVVQSQEVISVESSSWFSGGTLVRIVASFVGLFILQTVVSVWIMGNGDSDKKDRNFGIEGRESNIRVGMRNGEMGFNGNVNANFGNWVSQNMGGLEMAAKIAEIRRMANEAREAEKRDSGKGEEDVDDESDDDDDDDNGGSGGGDDLKSDSPRIRSGIMKEVDGRFTKLRSLRNRSPVPLVNVNLLNKAWDIGKESKNEDVVPKEEDNMLVFEKKHKFRSRLNTPVGKPKGFQSIEGDATVREKPRNVDDESTVETTGNADDNGVSSSTDNPEIHGLGSSLPGNSNIDSQTDEKKPESQSSSPLQASKKGFGGSSATKKFNKSQGAKKASQSNKRINGEPKPERGVGQDSSHGNPMDDEANLKDSSVTATQDASTTSKTKTHVVSRSKVQPNSDKVGSKLSLSRETNNWWFGLPHVLVVLMQRGPDSGQLGFYTVRIPSDAKNQQDTAYVVAFEDLGDATNFRYILESVFEDLPDATVDVIPLSPKELKEVMESIKKNVIVVKKGELRLYAGQPLAEVDHALRSLVK